MQVSAASSRPGHQALVARLPGGADLAVSCGGESLCEGYMGPVFQGCSGANRKLCFFHMSAPAHRNDANSP